MWNAKLVLRASGATKLIALKLRSSVCLLREALAIWNDGELKRKRQLLRKYGLIWMNRTRIGYQQAIWRWQCITSACTWETVFPNHSVAIRKLCSLASGVALRNCQLGFYRIALEHLAKMRSPPEAVIGDKGDCPELSSDDDEEVDETIDKASYIFELNNLREFNESLVKHNENLTRSVM